MASRSFGPVLQHIRKLVGRQSAEGLTDRQLLERFAAGRDDAAFTALVQRYGSMVLGVCRRVLNNPHDAEDAFQATFLVLARKAGAVGWQDSIGNWLYGVACRVAFKARAHAGRQRRLEQQGATVATEVSEADGPFEEAARRELWQVFDEELNRLPNRYRAPLVLCYLEGRTHEQAARELGCPAGSLSRHLGRARELLRERLARRGVGVATAGLAAVLTEKTLAAPLPDVLASSTVHAALVFTAGKTAAAALSLPVLSLAEGVLTSMLYTQWKIAAVVLLTLGVLGLGAGSALHGGRAGAAAETGDGPPTAGMPDALAAVEPPAAAPNGEAADPKPDAAKREARNLTVTQIRQRLGQPLTLDQGIPANTPLRDALEGLEGRFEIPIIINSLAFERDLQNREVESQPVRLQQVRGVPVGSVLHLVLDQASAAYLIRPGYLEVTTPQRANPAEWLAGDRDLPPRVTADFKKVPLDEALRQLAEMTGISIVLDRKNQADEAIPEVTATLNNVPLDTAVRMLANMSGLKSVALDGALYVTAPENAAELQEEQAKRQELRANAPARAGAGM